MADYLPAPSPAAASSPPAPPRRTTVLTNAPLAAPNAAGNLISTAMQTQNEMSVHYHTIRNQLSLKLEARQQKSLRGATKSAGDVSPEIVLDLGQSVNAGADAFDTDVHTIAEMLLLNRLHTSRSTGLTSAQVIAAREEYGRNQLSPPPSPNWIWLLFKQLLAGFNSVLWLAALFAFLSYKPFGEPAPDPTQIGLGVVLVLVVLFNSAFNLYQEVKSVRIIASFSKMLPSMCHVLRNGKFEELKASELVVGDIVQLKLGDKVPADVRLLEVSGLQVNNSALTGESEPVHCTASGTHPNFLESPNIAFFSSLVVQGSGVGVVVNTGDRTVLGTVSVLTRNSSQVEITSLHREINRFALIIVCLAAFFAILIWITWSSWLNQSTDPKFASYVTLNGNIINSVGLVVAFIPEGLPGAITLILTIVATRMYKRKVLVKSLATLETFNSVSIIATDKTGTLTQNKMTVTRLLWGLDQEYSIPIQRKQVSDISTQLSSSETTEETNTLPAGAADLLLGGALCNSAEMQSVDEGSGPVQQLVGDAADTALYEMQARAKQNVEQVRKQYPCVAVLPFNSTNKCMLTAHSDLDTAAGLRLLMKGAPELILPRCSTYTADDGSEQLLSPELRASILARQEDIAKGGFRVLALVQRGLRKGDLPNSATPVEAELAGWPTTGWRWCGMMTLLDPPRPEVPGAVIKCRGAGVRVAMVTGDHSATAAAIAYQCNILTKDVTDQNGLDTVQLVEDEMSRPCMELKRDGVAFKRHPLGVVSSLEEPQMNFNRARTFPGGHLGVGRKTLDQGVGSSTRALLTSDYWQQIRDRVIASLKLWWRHLRGLFLSASPITERAATVPNGVIVTGSDLRLFDDFMWDWALSHEEIVFARTSPEQKLRIVMQLQKRGEVVSVTGDGTNDAPALRRADLGVAMVSGTEVAREAGELVLLDNNFASIVAAIETGRLLGDNLKKVCVYLLPAGSWSELLPVLANEWIGMPLALSAFLMIIICMLTDLCGALAMVNEKPEANIMKRPPVIRNKEHLVDKRLIFHVYGFIGNIEVVAAFFNYLWYLNDNGLPPSDVFYQFNNFGSNTSYSADELLHINQVGQSIYFVTLVVMQFFNLLSTRTRYASFFQHNPFYGKGRNLYLIVAMVCASMVAIIVTQPTWFNDTFHTQPVPVKYVMPALGFGTALFLLDEGRKYCSRNYPTSIIAKVSW